MGNPRGADIFPAAREVMDRALDSEKGIKVTAKSWADATRLRFNCYTVRRREQDRNAKVYPEGHPMHSRSAYDKLSFDIIQEGTNWKLVIFHGAVDMVVEEL